jgi:hypothetical protein
MAIISIYSDLQHKIGVFGAILSPFYIIFVADYDFLGSK